MGYTVASYAAHDHAPLSKVLNAVASDVMEQVSPLQWLTLTAYDCHSFRIYMNGLKPLIGA